MAPTEIKVLDRLSRKKFSEKIYGERGLIFLYENPGLLAKILKFLMAKTFFISALFACFQRNKRSRKKILPFIRQYEINSSEFARQVEDFASFADFFVRKLKPTSRPICTDPSKAILPADARYLVFENIHLVDDFYVKGKRFDLPRFLQDQHLAQQYANGSMVIARLAPVDYHRFHFPFDCTASATKKISGSLYSVNPIALKRHMEVFWEKKRFLTVLHSEIFGKVLFIEVGATFVGKVHQSFISNRNYQKGEEKGYFDLGGSTIVMLFEPHTILFDADLVKASRDKIEMRALFGQSMGTASSGK